MNGNGRNQPGGGTWSYRASTQEGKKQHVWVGDLGVNTPGICQMNIKEKRCSDTVILGKPISERSKTELKASGRNREVGGIGGGSQAETGNGPGAGWGELFNSDFIEWRQMRSERGHVKGQDRE